MKVNQTLGRSKSPKQRYDVYTNYIVLQHTILCEFELHCAKHASSAIPGLTLHRSLITHISILKSHPSCQPSTAIFNQS